MQATDPITIHPVSNGIIVEAGRERLVFELGPGRKASALRDVLQAVHRQLAPAVGTLELTLEVSSPSGDDAAAGGVQPVMLSVDETVKLYGLSQRTLEKLRAEGRGPAYHEMGKRILYRRTDLDTWMNQHRVATEG